MGIERSESIGYLEFLSDRDRSHLKPHSGHLSVGSLVMSSLRPANHSLVKQKVLLAVGGWVLVDYITAK